jgi:hypothetical protein
MGRFAHVLKAAEYEAPKRLLGLDTLHIDVHAVAEMTPVTGPESSSSRASSVLLASTHHSSTRVTSMVAPPLSLPEEQGTMTTLVSPLEEQISILAREVTLDRSAAETPDDKFRIAVATIKGRCPTLIENCLSIFETPT